MCFRRSCLFININKTINKSPSYIGYQMFGPAPSKFPASWYPWRKALIIHPRWAYATRRSIWKTRGQGSGARGQNTGGGNSSSGGKEGVDKNLISEWYSLNLKAVRAGKSLWGISTIDPIASIVWHHSPGKVNKLMQRPIAPERKYLMDYKNDYTDLDIRTWHGR